MDFKFTYSNYYSLTAWCLLLTADVDSKHEVVNCQDQALVNHCYWPIVSDFINILSHKTIAKMFMQNTDLIKLWMKFIGYLTGKLVTCTVCGMSIAMK